ncbi:hypothetical protein DID88_009991 [Monilinia fructigena]|uniref:CPAF-like PDZ domain-containing protein n=1 Tax=Monilinia fructigena TaxID=38457 RepID=A0A395IMR5_9HELO|nr:hypothetical protein DID88_009991 [Monilinia fructigena]
MLPFQCVKLLLFFHLSYNVNASPTPETTPTLSAHSVIFNSSLAFECLTSVPFNAAVASRFISYYNDTLQFQSTLSYLKSPPTSYQQPAVDLLAGLGRIQIAIDEGVFANQYEFEATLQTLIYAAHDGHVDMLAGAFSAFSFASPRDIVSLSLDAICIKLINGKDATTYLSEFASVNSAGTLEAHADWNQLMLSAAQDIQGFFDVFSGGATFYPGDNITFLLENGTSWTENYLAIYNSPGPTGPLQTGGDFYNFFVLGFYPASYDPDEDSLEDDSSDDFSIESITSLDTDVATSTIPNPIPTGWNNTAYPEIPDIAQEDLGTFGDGVVSGYFLNSTSTSVLSIPSFDVDGDAVFSFQQAISQFIHETRVAGLKRVCAVFDASGIGLDMSDDSFAVYGYDANPAPSGARSPFAAEDIIILSDGICHSSCALFMEMFRHEAGVKVVAVGGTPSVGPMQAPSGSRGARDYDTSTLDANIDFTQQLLQNQSSPDATFLPNRTEQLSVFVYYADINLRDQVRKNEEIPLQFAYEAADCRIYYTPQTVYNYTNLWQYAADAIWKDSSLCVKDSTGYSSQSQNTTDFTGPLSASAGKTNITDYLSHLTTSPIANFILQELNDGLPAVNEGASRNAPASTKVIKCTKRRRLQRWKALC